MTSEFKQDLTNAQRELDGAREALLSVVNALSDDDFGRGRRGGWTVGRVLEHLIQSEWLYSRLVNHLRDLPVEQGEVSGSAPASAADAAGQLEASRGALLSAFDGVDEESFYRLRVIGHEEYSVLSILENEWHHDREHAEQVQSIVAAG